MLAYKTKPTVQLPPQVEGGGGFTCVHWSVPLIFRRTDSGEQGADVPVREHGSNSWTLSVLTNSPLALTIHQVCYAARHQLPPEQVITTESNHLLHQYRSSDVPFN